MLSAPIFWKVKSLVATHSAQSNEHEIENILKMNSDNDRISLLISLLDEVDFRDNYNRDEHKVRTLLVFLIVSKRIDNLHLIHFHCSSSF